MDAAEKLTPDVGRSAACRAMGVSRATVSATCRSGYHAPRATQVGRSEQGNGGFGRGQQHSIRIRWEFDASEGPQHNRFLRRRHLPPD